MPRNHARGTPLTLNDGRTYYFAPMPCTPQACRFQRLYRDPDMTDDVALTEALIPVLRQSLGVYHWPWTVNKALRALSGVGADSLRAKAILALSGVRTQGLEGANGETEP